MSVVETTETMTEKRLEPLVPNSTLLLPNQNAKLSTVKYELEDISLRKMKEDHTQAENSPLTVVNKSKPPKPPQIMIKISVLLSRSSGRDKFAAFLQYGAMFWGHQKLVPQSSSRDAAWYKLEESMSSGRKLLRLFKWLKELERIQRAYYVPDPGPHQSEARRNFMSVLGLFMHSFSFAYYFIDNVLYLSQTGIINRPQVVPLESIRGMLRSKLSHSEYLELQARFRSDELLRAHQKKFEGKLKDWKNYSSLLRLLAAIVYCSIQVDSAIKARKMLKCKSQERDMDKSELSKQQKQLETVQRENLKEIAPSVCNLVILLNRLAVPGFNKLPLWSIGLFGMISAMFGMEKNWPKG